MRKGRRIFLLLIVAASGVLVWALLSGHGLEPVYKGKPLSYWLAAYDAMNYLAVPTNDSSPPTWQAANEAIRQMGTNAIPGLLRRLEQHDSRFKLRVMGWSRNSKVFSRYYNSLDQDTKAYNAFVELGPAASNAVPGLLRIVDRDHSAFAQQAVPGILGHIGPAAASAVPVLLQRGITHTNAIVRNNSIYALRSIFPDPKLVVPEFIKCLDDPDPLVRAQAARGLGDYNEDAKAAFPRLVKLYQDEPHTTAKAATISGEPIVDPDSTLFPLLSPPDVKDEAAEAMGKIDYWGAKRAKAQTKDKIVFDQ